VPLRIGHYWQTLSSVYALAYDISDLARIREVSRVTFDEKQKPHWIAADEDGRRIVLNSGEYGDHRLFILNFDPQTGALTLDGRFRDPGQREGSQHGREILATRIPWRCLPAWDGVFAPCGCGKERVDKKLGHRNRSPVVDLSLRPAYHSSRCPRRPNPLGRRSPITASSARSAAAEWVWCMRPKTSSSVATPL